MVGPEDSSSLGAAVWTVEELIDVAERIISSEPGLFSHPGSDTNKDLNIRLIRDYVVREFIPRPERVGREGRFGFEHLVYLLAVRALLRSQKWSLPAIKASFANTGTEELLGGLLAPVRDRIELEYARASGMQAQMDVLASRTVRTPELNPAQLLIEQFKGQLGGGGKRTGTADGSPGAFARLLASPAAPAPARPPRSAAGFNRKLHLELEQGCEVVMDAQRMESLTREEAERLGEALKRRLKDEMAP